MNSFESLPPQALRWQCDADAFDFDTSDQLDALEDIIGQERAVEAIEFGIGIEGSGYNLFALGPMGTGKHEIVRHFLKQTAHQKPSPPDLCYVQNFEKERQPCKLLMPAGRGMELSEDMENLIEDLKGAIPAAFESEDYQSRHNAINQEFRQKQQEALTQLEEVAESRDIQLLRTPEGIGFAPVVDGEVIPPDQSDQLTEEQRERAEEAVEELEEMFRKELQSAPRWERERREKLKELREEVAKTVVEAPIGELCDKYAELDEVVDYLGDVKEDIVDHAEYFVLAKRAEHARMVSLAPDGEAGALGAAPEQSQGEDESAQAKKISFRRYMVNVLVDNSQVDGAPVIYEDDPTLDRLLGQIEHLAQYGALVTDFNLIQPGALHRANGGYLIIDARKLLMNPLSYEQLKRALFSEQIHIESAKQVMGMARTVTLDPEPIDLSVKVILLGERELYYKLDQMDHEFGELFKVAADFNEAMPREGNLQSYAKLVAAFSRENDCAPLDPPAMAQVLERAARLAGDRDKLSTHSESIRDLVREANYWAEQNGHEVIGCDDVQQAIDAQERRAGRVKERLEEQIERETLLIDTEGSVVGQVNGLSVLSIGRFAFGRPHRITASARLGKGELVDIERESELGGPIHSKGVLILGGFLGSRFGKKMPLSLTASLVFEQTYGGIDGDSASLAETCALLSELSDAPLRQDLALTGSINQQGRVQAIGGVNEKIEGFFDICKQRGLTGDQGAIIPASNVKHLMLREEVVNAVSEGQFHIYAVRSVDEAMQLLTGVEAGERDDEGDYPQETINARVARTLEGFARRVRRFHRPDED
ncbi:ATP-dependent protease [Persicimonas caeni]|uniref:endopeptidase La n=1 Tax=Persicimonas caeni TaxID=2292766 RepID=A0A4Y6PTJ3_PERCE|nr:ATP-binding protein [Persicimonas caeni]QDG51570.1 ATP-dependent protease [Persicimonas caeni]QED32791.1 AAA family ATPase [Persicimonas caeni]